MEDIEKEIEKVKEGHKTPWIEQWTIDNVEIFENNSDAVAEEISKSLDREHDWYADFKNDDFHYIIFRDKIFKIDRTSKEKYDEATKYGISLGIPDYQVDFSPHIKKWGR